MLRRTLPLQRTACAAHRRRCPAPPLPPPPQGRLTLLLGPPGAGKSVLLRRLTGQLEASPTLELGGEVRYNGRDPSTFDLERTAAFVDQVRPGCLGAEGAGLLACACLPAPIPPTSQLGLVPNGALC